MNPTIEMMRARRSVPPPALRGPGPSAGERDLILTLAARVPDHGKLKPWRFVVFEGERLARAGAIVAALHRAHDPSDPDRSAAEGRKFSAAPMMIAVVSRAAPHVKIPEWEQVLSAGAATMSLILAASALGFCCDWRTGWPAYDRRFLEAIGVGTHEKLAGFVHIGRAEGRPEDRPRPALDEIVTTF